MYQLGFFALVVVLVLLSRAFSRKVPPPTSVDPLVIEAFRKLWRQQMVWAVLLAPFIIWVLHSPSSGGAWHGPLWLIAGIILAWVGVHNYRYYRCPKCGAYLGWSPFHPWQCPSCRTALREPRDS